MTLEYFALAAVGQGLYVLALFIYDAGHRHLGAAIGLSGALCLLSGLSGVALGGAFEVWRVLGALVVR